MTHTRLETLTNEELLRYADSLAPLDELTQELVHRLQRIIDQLAPRYERMEGVGRMMPQAVYDALYGTLREGTCKVRK